jgi:hypothetical protein
VREGGLPCCYVGGVAVGIQSAEGREVCVEGCETGFTGCVSIADSDRGIVMVGCTF